MIRLALENLVINLLSALISVKFVSVSSAIIYSCEPDLVYNHNRDDYQVLGNVQVACKLLEVLATVFVIC